LAKSLISNFPVVMGTVCAKTVYEWNGDLKGREIQ
jgi:hypothetical protein